jgi:hypothetical protein
MMTLLDELGFQTGNPEILAALGGLMKEPGAQDKLAEAYRRVVGLSGRVINMKALAEALRVLIGLERECYSLDIEADAGTQELPGQLGACSTALVMAMLCRPRAASRALLVTKAASTREPSSE